MKLKNQHPSSSSMYEYHHCSTTLHQSIIYQPSSSSKHEDRHPSIIFHQSSFCSSIHLHNQLLKTIIIIFITILIHLPKGLRCPTRFFSPHTFIQVGHVLRKDLLQPYRRRNTLKQEEDEEKKRMEVEVVLTAASVQLKVPDQRPGGGSPHDHREEGEKESEAVGE